MVQWVLNTNTEAHGDGVGAGEMNTMLIIANQGSDSNNYAAGLCANLVITNSSVDHGDWYFPSIHELNLMYFNIGTGGAAPANEGGFASMGYWSSTEFDDNDAWIRGFDDGFLGNVNKVLTINRVRCIRAF
jgi:hypothetical protein